MEQDEKSFGPCKAGFARCEELLPTLPEGSEVRNAIAALLSEYHHTVEEERKVRELVREVERGSDRTIYTQRARITELESLLAEAGEALGRFIPAANDWIGMGDSRPINQWQVDNRGDYPVTVGMLNRAASVSNQIAGMKENGK